MEGLHVSDRIDHRRITRNRQGVRCGFLHAKATALRPVIIKMKRPHVHSWTSCPPPAATRRSFALTCRTKRRQSERRRRRWNALGISTW